uniref:Uncharacterized protein n=1 Tax=Timema douglasi TaxID=61478 RepID=A0A7R8VAP0_TIMDO|nr:unnamed protein product [Timema douglasi]
MLTKCNRACGRGQVSCNSGTVVSVIPEFHRNYLAHQMQLHQDSFIALFNLGRGEYSPVLKVVLAKRYKGPSNWLRPSTFPCSYCSVHCTFTGMWGSESVSWRLHVLLVRVSVCDSSPVHSRVPTFLSTVPSQGCGALNLCRGDCTWMWGSESVSWRLHVLLVRVSVCDSGPVHSRVPTFLSTVPSQGCGALNLCRGDCACCYTNVDDALNSTSLLVENPSFEHPAEIRVRTSPSPTNTLPELEVQFACPLLAQLVARMLIGSGVPGSMSSWAKIVPLVVGLVIVSVQPLV